MNEITTNKTIRVERLEHFNQFFELKFDGHYVFVFDKTYDKDWDYIADFVEHLCSNVVDLGQDTAVYNDLDLMIVIPKV